MFRKIKRDAKIDIAQIREERLNEIRALLSRSEIPAWWYWAGYMDGFRWTIQDKRFDNKDYEMGYADGKGDQEFVLERYLNQ